MAGSFGSLVGYNSSASSINRIPPILFAIASRINCSSASIPGRVKSSLLYRCTLPFANTPKRQNISPVISVTKCLPVPGFPIRIIFKTGSLSLKPFSCRIFTNSANSYIRVISSFTLRNPTNWYRRDKASSLSCGVEGTPATSCTCPLTSAISSVKL